MNNILSWISDAKKKLVECDLPVSSVYLILEKVYGSNYKLELYTGGLVYSHQLDDILNDVLKCSVPISYIVGFEYFYGRKFIVNSNVLIPRIETENLIETAVEKILTQFPMNSELDILDMCTGSGIIGITIMKELEQKYQIKLTMADLSKEALEVCEKNLALHKINAKLVEGNLFENIHEKYDVILTNPPYVPYNQKLGIMVKENEPHLALFAEDEGLAIYKKFAKSYEFYVKNEYLICIEIGDGQKEAVCELMKNQNNEVECTNDLFDRERNVFTWRKNDL